MIASLLSIRSVACWRSTKWIWLPSLRTVFDDIVAGFEKVRAHLGELSVVAIPICARDGDNVTTASARMPWYRGETLLSALEAAEPPSRSEMVSRRDFPCNMSIVRISRSAAMPVTIASGIIQVGDRIANVTSRTEATIARIVTMDGDRESAPAGLPVTLLLDREIDVSRGDVLAADPPPMLADQINAWVVWMDETPLFRGRAYQFVLGTKSVVGTITDITNRLDIDTLQ